MKKNDGRTVAKNASPRLAVFDCDGTLVDSQHSIIASMTGAWEELGMPGPDPEAVRRIVGLPLGDAIASLIPDAGAETLARLVEGYRRHFSALRRDGRVREPLFPGVLEGLRELEDRGWLLGVATGKASHGLLATLDGHGLGGRFQTLQTSDKGPGKPNPDMLFRAMDETGVTAARTAMIGDTTFDMLMARGADVIAIGVTWGYHDAEELSTAGARALVEHFTDLPGLLEEMMEVE